MTGERGAVEIAEYVYFYLTNLLDSLTRSYLNARAADFSAATATQSASYRIGVLNGLNNQLLAQKGAKRAKPESSHALVPLKNTPAFQAYFEERYPRLRRTVYGRARYDGNAFQAGFTQGEQLSIRPGVRSTQSSRFLT